MAKQLKKTPKKHIGRPAYYPWNEWTNGRWWEVHKGNDFDTGAKSFQRLLYSVATRLGKKVTTQVDGESVRFQFKAKRFRN